MLPIIPTPKLSTVHGELKLSVDRPFTACLPKDSSTLVRIAANQALAYLSNSGCAFTTLVERMPSQDAIDVENKAYVLRFVVDQSEGERYQLVTGGDETLFSGSPRGLMHAVQTWTQLLKPTEDGTQLLLTEALIEDEPDISVRGVFAECFTGSDRMQLKDWHDLIDELVSLKLNTLSIGINGSWPMRYEPSNSRLDFLFVPLIDEPERWGGRQITYYDPTTGQEQTESFTVPIYEQDLLGNIMEYAQDRGIRTIPLFNGPGHTTVLSQLYPQISAKDANGNPTGYGYSFSHPETMPMLKQVYTRLVERYMKPNGQTWVHIGCDEIHPYHYMNERMSDKAVSPWCSEDLKHFTKKELYFNYIRELGSHLVELGMDKIIIWHDGHSMFGFDESFESMLEEAGLAGKLAIHWWRYHEPHMNIPHVRGAENWVAPATGYFPHIVHQDFLDNIEIMVNEGVAKYAQAVIAYAVYSPLQHRNTAFLAEKTWNTQARVVPFESTYANLVSADEASVIPMEDGLRRMRQVFGQYGHCYFLIETSIYFSNYYPRKPYPARILNTLANNEHGVETLTRLLGMDLTRALSYFAQVTPRPEQRRLFDYCIMECTRTQNVLQALQHFSAALRIYEQVRVHHPNETSMLTEALSRMKQAKDSLQAALLIVRETQVHYYLPASYRDYTPLMRSIDEVLIFIESAIHLAPGNLSPIPLKGIRLEVLPNPRAAMLDEA